MSKELERRIDSISVEVDPEIRSELRMRLRTHLVGDSKGVVIGMNSLVTQLMRLVFLGAGRVEHCADLYSSICLASQGDPAKKSAGLDLIPREIATTLHTLRINSNVLDHAVGSIPVGEEDAENMLRNYLRVLRWFYRHSDHGPKLERFYDEARTIDFDDKPSAAVKGGMQIALIYRRKAEPDCTVIDLLEKALTASGHNVFVDRNISIGVEWVRELSERIKGADIVVPLLSEASVHSEMLAKEVELSQEAAQENSGRPRLLPIRICNAMPLPKELQHALGRSHCLTWESESDNDQLLASLHQAIENPAAPQKPVSQDESDTGALGVESEFYVVRENDEEFNRAISRGDSIVLVKGARQMGKTSLLARGLQVARQDEGGRFQVAFTDLQKFSPPDFESDEGFFIALGEYLSDQLEMDNGPSESWNSRLSANVNFERFMRRKVLANPEVHLVWGLDEVDRLFAFDYSSSVFGLFRSWHNERALNPDGPWSRLTLVIAYATEAHLFIQDINQSPFNVGTRVSLQDFTLAQVADLNQRRGAPLTPEDLAPFYGLVAGQPFLVQRGLRELRKSGGDLVAFAKLATESEGPFGDHLKRMLIFLVRDPELREAVVRILTGQECESPESFYRLRSAGVLSGSTPKGAKMRCAIYGEFLRGHLL